MKILKIDTIKIDYERGSSSMEEIITIITTKEQLFYNFSETAEFYILEDPINFNEVVTKTVLKEFIEQVREGGN